MTTEPTLHYVIYDLGTGEIVQSGVNKPTLIESMCRDGCGVLYAAGHPRVHVVDVSADPPELKLQESERRA